MDVVRSDVASVSDELLTSLRNHRLPAKKRTDRLSSARYEKVYEQGSSSKVLRLEKAIPLSEWRVRGFAAAKEYDILKQLTDTDVTREMLAPHSKFKKKNRYKDILPLEHSRVKLHSESDSEFDAYINANFVDSPLQNGDGKVIASQGPLSNTCVDFWKMIS